ncbi:MAG: DUF3822 family protein [Flavobacterium sp.]
MSITTNITDKKYKKLILQVALDGFSYCVFDTLNHSAEMVESINFSDFQKNSKPEELYQKAFSETSVLSHKYDEVLVLHDNNLNTFVPKALFDKNLLKEYLQFNNKVFENDFFTFDEMANQEMNNVYIPYVNINNFLIDWFGSFNYKHSNSILVSKLLNLSKNIEERLFFAHVQADKFEIVIVENQKLLLFNSFEYKTKEDFIYYILFVAEQLNLNPEFFKLYLFGDISEESDLYKIAYKYIRNIDFLDLSGYQDHFSTAENSKYFILFNS